MSVHEVQEKLTKAFLERDEAALRQLCSADIEFVMPGIAVKGIDAYIEMARGWWNAFPDMDIQARGVYVDGETAVEEGVFAGTNTGPMPGPTGLIPATGKRVEVPYLDCFTIRGGKVVSDRLVMDRLTMLEQLGLIPAGALG